MKLAARLLPCLLLPGCISMAPDYERPEAPVPEMWPDTTEVVIDGNSALQDWRTFIVDPRLQRLIELGLEHNRDLRIATQNLRRTQALYGIQRSEQFPNIDVQANGINQKLPEALNGTETISRQYNVDLGILSYELDFWGRVNSLENQALYAYLASEQGRRNTQIILISQIASAYFTLAADKALLALAEETLRSQRASLALTQQSFDNGVVSGLDVAQAEVTVATARVDVADYSNRVAADINALAVLVGEQIDDTLLPQADGPGELGGLAPIQVGLPSLLLTQRPDIQQAEFELIAANASIGAARAAYFPTISLTATAGVLSSDLDDLFSGDAGTWNFTPSISLPIFHWGEIRSGVEVAKADQQIALAQYEQSIQIAFQEVADALAGRQFLDQQFDAQQMLVAATGETFRLSELRFRQGVDNFFTVLDSQRSYYSAQQVLIAVNLNQQANLINLFRALGGGWTGSPSSEFSPESSPETASE
ncbi:efflux transporter outer membrane subunit [Ferrimonas marina]|uniref:Outer membrane protein, multidrug efflux system n=1 Tax=Ferrimonas marina TaxID=299255 RepID=A0A1M5P1L1_9GAMM|nr:efflux transporter outer membrane subunit [Ferrimonas marina]SHG95618.1 outer membrane protein, multidrug efflux system [Ferrimonas marina]